MTEDEKIEFDKLEKRVNNSENAILAFYALIMSDLDLDTQIHVEAMLADYIKSSSGLGANFEKHFDGTKH